MNATHQNKVRAAHAAAGGDLCRKTLGDFVCADCGVALTECTSCTGIGYHRDGCPESEATQADNLSIGIAALLRQHGAKAVIDSIAAACGELRDHLGHEHTDALNVARVNLESAANILGGFERVSVLKLADAAEVLCEVES